LKDGTVLVAGGVDNVPETIGTAEVYNPATNSFSALTKMTTPRFGHTATLLTSGKVLVAGGSDNTNPLASAEIFDPSTGTFSSVGNMANPRYFHVAALLNDGTVLVAGAERPQLLRSLWPNSSIRYPHHSQELAA
jgi:hypothetical protein